MRFHCADHLVGTHHVDRVYVQEILLVDAVQLEVRVEFGPAGVVDQVVNAPPGFHRSRRQGTAIGVFGHVCLHYPGLCAGRFATLGGCKRLLLATGEVHYDVAPASRQEFGRSCANTGGRAGHDGGFPFVHGAQF